ncbi:MAG TPA: hypothetical protein VN943_08165 [Candidatus Acidoferrum sp.]|nr:hypothetical protein [Candidatus Dormibacteraeota bacterium]HXN51895.1 hypothetical protein [Candidatus Acidoferrum sp.]
MRDTLGVFFALVLFTLGAALLNDGSSQSDLSQTAKIIGGAASLSVGVMSMCSALKNWLKWKRGYKEYREE